MALRLFNEKNEKIRNEKNGKSKRNLYQNLNKNRSVCNAIATQNFNAKFPTLTKNAIF